MYEADLLSSLGYTTVILYGTCVRLTVCLLESHDKLGYVKE